jgi:hypothetical protein
MIPNLAANLWVDAALSGAALGLAGAGLFVLVSSILCRLAEQRRTRQALQRFAHANDKSVVERLARTPGVLVKAQDALDNLLKQEDAPRGGLSPHRTR